MNNFEPWMHFPIVFMAMELLDWIYAEYVKAAAGRLEHKASFHAACLILITGFVTTSYVANPWLLIAAFFGAYAGTWLSIKHFK